MRVRMNVSAVCVAMALAVSGAACGGGGDSPTSPTTATGPTTIETYTGTVGIGATATHAFPTASAGTISILLESVGPVSTQAIGLGVGVWDGASCILALSTNAATQGIPYEAVTNSLGNYCITLSDPGTFTETNTYQVRVTHPQG